MKSNDMFNVPMYFLEDYNDNDIYIMREDLIPFSFGGNKARKGLLFWNEIKNNKSNYVVTYGSSASNHCRVIANIAASENLPCTIISPEEIAHDTFNKHMMTIFGSEIIYCKVSEVHDTIENKLNELRMMGYNPYFIQGGGHGNIGTQAYVNCYEEILNFEANNNVRFDYIFHASGTGTTQAGLVCGQLINNDERKIVGISIARKLPYGRDIVVNSIKEYMESPFNDSRLDNLVLFDDSCILDGYGSSSEEIDILIKSMLCKYGIPMDKTYTGKAFYGMRQYIDNHKLERKKVLFIHTGGTPLFFDDIMVI